MQAEWNKGEMMIATTTKRDAITAEQLAAIQHHAGWDDGRIGYEWARFDSGVLGDDPRYLRAEITWDDDGVNGPFFAPILTLESNRCRPDGSLETWDVIDIPIDFATAVRILAADPTALLGEYAAEFAGLAR